jgi:hypothetical protein
VGRSLLAAPFLVLLQQLHESRGLLSASPAVRDAMTRAGLDVADLGTALAQTEAAATDAELTLRAAHTEVDLVEVARAAWRTDAVACLRAARLRANLLDRADQAPLREAVLQLTRSHGARRFASLVEALTTLRGLVDAHHRVADGWGDPVVAAVDPLLHTARDLAAQSERAARTRADASRAATEVRSALQQVLRRLRAAWDLARLTDPHLEPLPATTLRDHAPRTRGRPGVKEAGPSVKEAGPSVKEAGPSVKEAGPSVKEAGPSVKEAVPSVKEAVPSVKDPVPSVNEGGAPRENL